MYAILPEFMKNSDIEQMKKDIISTKTNIINAYSYVDIEAWDNVQKEIVSAEKKMVNMDMKIKQEKELLIAFMMMQKSKMSLDIVQ